MPPKSRKRVASEDYESDGGFIEDAPKSKKAKSSAKAPLSYEMKQDDDGNDYWELSRMRRLQVSDFKNTTMINIREYYEKDGKTLPGKKGISLSIDQYTAFLELLPQVESVLKAKGIDVPRPQYNDAPAKKPKKEVEDKVVEDDDEEEAYEDAKPAKSKLDKFRLKKNHEATSDEDNE